MGRPKSVQPPPEPEEESQELPEDEPEAEVEPEEDDGPEVVSKSEAIRRAIQSGHDTPATGVPWIKDEFGIDIGATHFSSVKSNEAKKAGKGGKSAPRSTGRPKGSSPAAPASAPRTEAPRATRPTQSSTGDSLSLSELQEVKALAKKLGADKVRSILDLFD